MENLTKHPNGGSVTGEYFKNDDGSVKVAALVMKPEAFSAIKGAIAEYTWNASDFLLTSYPKNGTHFMWEVMTMLLHGSADYVKNPKEVLFIDAFPISEGSKIIPPPRVLNTHYRTDVLPAEFRKGKTVIVIRNPKDACVSYYHHETKLTTTALPHLKHLADMKFSDYARAMFFDKDQPLGSYFDYTEYMWTLRDDPNHLLVFYEDLKLEPVATIQKVNEFMGTNASPELVQKIADVTSFDKMKKAKLEGDVSKGFKQMREARNKEGGNKDGGHEEEGFTEKVKGMLGNMYRKGGIGDWKNHFTVADNEMFDEFLAGWEGGKDIPFKY